MNSRKSQRVASPAARSVQGERLLRLPEVLKVFPVGRTPFYAGIAAGDYPQPVRISRRAVAWRASDIKRLIETLERSS